MKKLILAAALAVALPAWADSKAETMEAAKAYLNVSTECYNDVFDSATQYERSRWCLKLYEAHTNYINAGGAYYEEVGHWSSHSQFQLRFESERCGFDFDVLFKIDGGPVELVGRGARGGKRAAFSTASAPVRHRRTVHKSTGPGAAQGWG